MSANSVDLTHPILIKSPALSNEFLLSKTHIYLPTFTWTHCSGEYVRFFNNICTPCTAYLDNT